MGVMQCNRDGCENILCDRYSSEYGYICYACFEELVNTDPLNVEQFMTNTLEQARRPRSYYNNLFSLQ